MVPECHRPCSSSRVGSFWSVFCIEENCFHQRTHDIAWRLDDHVWHFSHIRRQKHTHWWPMSHREQFCCLILLLGGQGRGEERKRGSAEHEMRFPSDGPDKGHPICPSGPPHTHTHTTPGFSQFEAQLIMMEAAALLILFLCRMFLFKLAFTLSTSCNDYCFTWEKYSPLYDPEICTLLILLWIRGYCYEWCKFERWET